MEFLPPVFYDHLASHLEDYDLFKISVKFCTCMLTEVSHIHYKKRRNVTLFAVQNEGEEWIFCCGDKPNRTLADMTKYEYVNEVAFLYNRNVVPYFYPFFWKDSLEKTLRVLPRYLRQAKITWDRDIASDEVKRYRLKTNFWDIFFASSLSRAPFSEVYMPYVDHRSEEFLRQQISFRGLEKLKISRTSPPSVWDCIEELLRQPQLNFLWITDMFAVSSRMLEALINKLKCSKFKFDIRGKKHSDFDLRKWRADFFSGQTEERSGGGSSVELGQLFHQHLASRTIRYYHSGQKIGISCYS
uniref:F-box domain-containing protein n=1 Tax=Steinernema glaseri TaxID=37863 RepID=A0A1I7Z1H8_9BILA